MRYIGVDLGTSAVKLLLMTGEGEILKIVSREYPVSFPKNGWSEQDPEDWYKQTVDGIKELVASTGDGEIAGISVAGQMHGLVTLDSDDKVIRKAILWNDGRSQEESDYLNNEIGKRKLTELTGNISYAGFTAPKILWMQKNEPENFKRISKIMLPKDYLTYMFTGVCASDPSDASGTLFYDVKNRCWSKEMCDILGITEAQLPKVYESYEKVGEVKPELCKELGITSTCIVAAGAGDNAGAAVGMGIVGEGKCNISLGTSGTVFISSNSFSEDFENHLHSFAHSDGAYHVMGCILSAASCNKWWLEEICETNDYGREGGLIKEDNLGKNRIYFLPYLMGERSPINDTDARSAFVGMSMDTTRGEMTQAVYEGVSFALRDCLEAAKEMGIDVKESCVCGGGSKSKIWLKILSDILGIRLSQTDNTEGPSFGAAILASVANGEYKSVEEACSKLIKVTQSVDPDAEQVKLYEERYQEYKKIYPALKETYAFIAGRRD
ncbi:xylulokinase [Oscillospiraceae bacterium]|nr:xylulokinase [Oscillospiraceae bacterium]